MSLRANAIGYVRVSTEEQALEGVSLQAQQHRIQAYCTMRELQLVDIIQDAGVSGARPLGVRGGGRTLLQMIQTRKAASVVSLKLDRLFRDAADCLTVLNAWDRNGVGLHLVDLGGQAIDTSGAMGRFFLTMLAGLAEFERNQIRERTSTAMCHMAKMGMYTGGYVPYGYRLDAEGLVEEPEEQDIIKKARELRGTGASLRRIASELASLGHLSRAGKTFVPCQIQRMVADAA